MSDKAKYPTYEETIPLLKSERFSLLKIDPINHAEELYRESHKDANDQRLIWEYLPDGPFNSLENFRKYLAYRIDPESGLVSYCIQENSTGALLGTVSYMNIQPQDKSIEIGHIWYVTKAQGGGANTEVSYLMTKVAFEYLGFMRMEWKCNNLNRRSKEAAIKLGFKFEGIFRNKLNVKGRNRDSAYFSILHEEWTDAKTHLEKKIGRHSSLKLKAKL